ncbi:MAG: pilus assembly protein [Sphingomonas fennica]
MTRRLLRDTRGVSAVEFAIIAMPMLIAFLGVIDLGMRQYMSSLLQDSMDQAARQVTVGGVTPAAITTFVNDRMRMVLPGSNTVVTPQSYSNFSKVGKPEPITTDTAPIGSYNTGDCFTDLNRNGRWDANGGAGGHGTGDDVVYYTAVARYPAIMPMRALLGWSDTTEVSATMMMRNQPYAAQAQPVTVCT